MATIKSHGVELIRMQRIHIDNESGYIGEFTVILTSDFTTLEKSKHTHVDEYGLPSVSQSSWRKCYVGKFTDVQQFISLLEQVGYSRIG